jgi:hypothetical protein
MTWKMPEKRKKADIMRMSLLERATTIDHLWRSCFNGEVLINLLEILLLHEVLFLVLLPLHLQLLAKQGYLVLMEDHGVDLLPIIVNHGAIATREAPELLSIVYHDIPAGRNKKLPDSTG